MLIHGVPDLECYLSSDPLLREEAFAATLAFCAKVDLIFVFILLLPTELRIHSFLGLFISPDGQNSQRALIPFRKSCWQLGVGLEARSTTTGRCLDVTTQEFSRRCFSGLQNQTWARGWILSDYLHAPGRGGTHFSSSFLSHASARKNPSDKSTVATIATGKQLLACQYPNKPLHHKR